MEDLKGAAQELRESIQAVAQTKPGPDRDRALRQAHDALLETQQAMVALPPQLRTEDPRYAAAQDKAMDRLKQAAERLRESVQAMAQQPPGDGRNRAMQQARSALWDTQQAMVAVFDPHPARGDAKGGQAPAADKARGS